MFKNITSALIACGLVTPVWAATDAIFDDPFFTDSQLTVSAKNYWKYLKEEKLLSAINLTTGDYRWPVAMGKKRHVRVRIS